MPIADNAAIVDASSIHSGSRTTGRQLAGCLPPRSAGGWLLVGRSIALRDGRGRLADLSGRTIHASRASRRTGGWQRCAGSFAGHCATGRDPHWTRFAAGERSDTSALPKIGFPRPRSRTCSRRLTSLRARLRDRGNARAAFMRAGLRVSELVGLRLAGAFLARCAPWIPCQHRTTPSSRKAPPPQADQLGHS